MGLDRRGLVPSSHKTSEACIGYFGIRDIGLLFKRYWDIFFFFFFFLRGEDMGYLNFFWELTFLKRKIK